MLGPGHVETEDRAERRMHESVRRKMKGEIQLGKEECSFERANFGEEVKEEKKTRGRKSASRALQVGTHPNEQRGATRETGGRGRQAG